MRDWINHLREGVYPPYPTSPCPSLNGKADLEVCTWLRLFNRLSDEQTVSWSLTGGAPNAPMRRACFTLGSQHSCEQPNFSQVALEESTPVLIFAQGKTLVTNCRQSTGHELPISPPRSTAHHLSTNLFPSHISPLHLLLESLQDNLLQSGAISTAVSLVVFSALSH